MANIDTSALTGWASPAAVETAAGDIKDAGKAVQDTTADAKSTWAGLAGVYQAPEQDIVLGAFDDVGTAGDDVQAAAITVSDALNTFASEVRTLMPERNRLMDAATAANADPGDPVGAGPGNPNYAGQISLLAGKYKAAEDTCATSVMGAHPSWVKSTAVGGPGMAGGPLVGLGLGVGEQAAKRTHRSPIAQRKADAPRIDSERLKPASPRVDTTWQGKNYTKSGPFYLPTDRVAQRSLPELPETKEYAHPVSLQSDPSDARPPRWAKFGGGALGAVGAGVTLWDAGASRWRQDMAEHPEWETSERVTSAGIDTAVVGGSSLAGAWAGAKAGAVVGTMVGGPVGAVIGAAVGGAIGGLIGKEFGEEIRGAFDGAADAVAEGVGDAVDKAGEVWDSLWG